MQSFVCFFAEETAESISDSVEGSLPKGTEIWDRLRLQMEPLLQAGAYDINKCFLYHELPTFEETVTRRTYYLSTSSYYFRRSYY